MLSPKKFSRNNARRYDKGSVCRRSLIVSLIQLSLKKEGGYMVWQTIPLL